MSEDGFDLSETSTEDAFAPVPDGVYPVTVEKTEWKEPKAGGAEYLNVQFSVTGENFANRKIFMIYNIHHEKEQPRNIARSQFKKTLLAIGYSADVMKELTKVSACEMILDHELFLKVGTKKSTDEYGDKNVIKDYISMKAEEAKEAPKHTPF